MSRPQPAKSAASRRGATINLRLSEQNKGLIDAAAAALGKTRTEFMVESAKLHAIDVLLDQRWFELEPEQWDALQAALDNPPAPTEQLKHLLAKAPPWSA